MSDAEIFDRIRAWEAGTPLPRGRTLGWPRAPHHDRLVIAFVRMGGESSPWGVAIGPPDEEPQCFVSPEPRNADEHAAFVAQFGPLLLDHLDHPRALTQQAREALLESPAPLLERVRLRQLWMPGPSHVAMLHFLDFRYTTTRRAEASLLTPLRQTGRGAGWLFRESTRPGQVRVHDATARLQQAFTFPVEPGRQQHLGHLLAWLKTPGDRDARIEAAAAAEALTVGVTMDPVYERKVLQPLLEQYRETRDKPAQWVQIGFQLKAALQPELVRRWKLTVQALGLLDADPRPSNPQLDPVVDLGASEFLFAYWRGETRGLDPSLTDDERKAFVTHPETDFLPARAAQRYFSYLHAHELAQAELVHGDPTLIAAALEAGDGFQGTVQAVTPGPRGAVTWVVVCPADGALRVREEGSVCVAGTPKRTAKVTALDSDGAVRTITLDMNGGKTAKAVPGQPAVSHPGWVGKTVTFVDGGISGISQRKAMRVHNVDGPGTWLTHATPLPEPAPVPAERSDLVGFLRSLEAPQP